MSWPGVQPLRLKPAQSSSVCFQVLREKEALLGQKGSEVCPEPLGRTRNQTSGLLGQSCLNFGGLRHPVPFISEEEPPPPPRTPLRLREKKNKADSQLGEQPAGQVAAAETWLPFSFGTSSLSFSTLRVGGVQCDYSLPL